MKVVSSFGGLRLAAWSGLIGGVVLATLACSPDRTPDIPDDTPNCEDTCNAAWPCGGVLENDLATCLELCDEETHGLYRTCVVDTVCEEMFECKIYAPGDAPTPEPPGDTDI